MADANPNANASASTNASGGGGEEPSPWPNERVRQVALRTRGLKREQLERLLRSQGAALDGWRIEVRSTASRPIRWYAVHPHYGWCNSWARVLDALRTRGLPSDRPAKQPRRDAGDAAGPSTAAAPSSPSLLITHDDDDVIVWEDGDGNAAAGEGDAAQPSCGICFCEPDPKVELGVCGHPYCAGCLAQYLAKTDVLVLLDDVTMRPHCPTCKTLDDHCGVMSAQDVEALVAGGHLAPEDAARIDAASLDAVAKYQCVACKIRFDVDVAADVAAGDEPRDRYKVTCGRCETVQCARCGVTWESHGDRACADVQAQAMTSEDRRAMEAVGAKPCPGGCGAVLSKDESVHACNVLRCTRCRIYVCARCGKQLDSSEYRDGDYLHARANAHYRQILVDGARNPCFGRMYDSEDSS